MAATARPASRCARLPSSLMRRPAIAQPELPQLGERANSLRLSFRARAPRPDESDRGCACWPPLHEEPDARSFPEPDRAVTRSHRSDERAHSARPMTCFARHDQLGWYRLGHPVKFRFMKSGHIDPAALLLPV